MLTLKEGISRLEALQTAHDHDDEHHWDWETTRFIYQGKTSTGESIYDVYCPTCNPDSLAKEGLT